MLSHLPLRGLRVAARPGGRALCSAAGTGGAEAGIEPWAFREVPIEAAETPPPSWYGAEALDREARRVFITTTAAGGGFGQPLYLGNAETMCARDGQYVADKFMHANWLMVRSVGGGDGVDGVQAFHNVCRHHATQLVSGAGCLKGRHKQFVCPYHGWRYDTRGALKRAERMKGVKRWNVKEMGLLPIPLTFAGPLAFGYLGAGVHRKQQEQEQQEPQALPGLGQAGELIRNMFESTANGMELVAIKEWELKCNWKVFVENYLDGGYHVSHAHADLAAQLDLDSYTTELLDRGSSVQRTAGSTADNLPEDARVTSHGAEYLYVYPNLMVNHYFPWLDLNIVIPTAADRCIVRFEWYMDRDTLGTEGYEDHDIQQALRQSEKVQEEDVELSERVQTGLGTPAYAVHGGRYAPAVESPMKHFHDQLADDLFG